MGEGGRAYATLHCSMTSSKGLLARLLPAMRSRWWAWRAWPGLASIDSSGILAVVVILHHSRVGARIRARREGWLID